MKNQNTNHSESNTGGNQGSLPKGVKPAELAAAQRWWASLEPIEKITAFEIAVVAHALQEKPVNEVLGGEVALQKAFKKFMYELGETFETRPWVLMHFYDARPELGGGFAMPLPLDRN
jgi:hypothetical protein